MLPEGRGDRDSFVPALAYRWLTPLYDPLIHLTTREATFKRTFSSRPGSDPGCAFSEGMSFDLPYPDGSFDRVVSSLFFHHLTRVDKERSLAERIARSRRRDSCTSPIGVARRTLR